nr:D-alanine--D-alanine ligase family [Tanacetum cinerariifolium]
MACSTYGYYNLCKNHHHHHPMKKKTSSSSSIFWAASLIASSRQNGGGGVMCCNSEVVAAAQHNNNNNNNNSNKKKKVMSDDDFSNKSRRRRRRVLKVGLICGGPSAERGISLNSARSLLDHIQGDDLHVSCYYIDPNLNAFAISSAQVYSNTPADFDFKLESLAQSFETLTEFAEHLAASVDIVFPVIHGRFGEDGGIQALLEKSKVPFVGTRSKECRTAFDKGGLLIFCSYAVEAILCYLVGRILRRRNVFTSGGGGVMCQVVAAARRRRRRRRRRSFKTLTDFAEHLAASVDIVFPVIHGRFGEDGGIQALLEKSKVPFVGTRSKECRTAFDKENEQPNP